MPKNYDDLDGRTYDENEPQIIGYEMKIYAGKERPRKYRGANKRNNILMRHPLAHKKYDNAGDRHRPHKYHPIVRARGVNYLGVNEYDRCAEPDDCHRQNAKPYAVTY